MAQRLSTPSQATSSTGHNFKSVLSDHGYCIHSIIYPITPITTDYSFHFLKHANAKPESIISHYFPNNWHYVQHSGQHSRICYEKILEETCSITIDHVYSKKDKSLLQYSKLHIHKIISPGKWGHLSIF